MMNVYVVQSLLYCIFYLQLCATAWSYGIKMDAENFFNVTFTFDFETEGNEFNRLFPVSVVPGSGFITMGCQATKHCLNNQVYLYFPNGTRINNYNNVDAAVEVRLQLEQTDLGNYTCRCGLNKGTILYNYRLSYKLCTNLVHNCRRAAECAMRYDQLNGCVLKWQRSSGKTCNELTADDCLTAHSAPSYVGYHMHKSVVCTRDRKRFPTLCAALSAAVPRHEMPLMVVDERVNCPTKDNYTLFHGAIYVSPDTCNISKSKDWQVQAYMSTIPMRRSTMTLCYVCHPNDSTVEIYSVVASSQHKCTSRPIELLLTEKESIHVLFKGTFSMAEITIRGFTDPVDPVSLTKVTLRGTDKVNSLVCRYKEMVMHLGLQSNIDWFLNQHVILKPTESVRPTTSTLTVSQPGTYSCQFRIYQCTVYSVRNNFASSISDNVVVVNVADHASSHGALYLTLIISIFSFVLGIGLIVAIWKIWSNYKARKRLRYLTGSNEDSDNI